MNETNCWAALKRTASKGEQEQRAFAVRYAPAVSAYLAARWEGSALAAQAEAAVAEIFNEIWQRARAMQESDAAELGEFRSYLLNLSQGVAGRVESRKSVPVASERSQFAGAYHRAWARVVMRLAAAEQAERVRNDPEGRRRIELLRLRYFGGLALSAVAGFWKTDPRELEKSFERAQGEFEAALLHVVAYHAPGGARSPREECDELHAILKAAGR